MNSSNDFREQVESQKITFLKVRNMAMGIFIIGVGITGMVMHYKGTMDFTKFPGTKLVYPLFSLFVLYGSFRAYRGYKGEI